MSDYPFKAPSKNPFSSPKKKNARLAEGLNRVERVVAVAPPQAPAPKPIEKPSKPLPPLTMEEKTCRSCEFYAFDEKMERHEAYKGECRRHAPDPREGDSRAFWPAVTWDGWCGEWDSGVSNEDMVRMARDIGEQLAQEEDF